MIDDDEDVLLAAKMLLKKHNYQVIIEKNPNKIPFLLNNDVYDVILLDMNFSKDTTSGKEGFEWLSKIKERDAQAVVIMITAFGDVEMAVRALKEGATDFILKPWQNEKLIATISTAIKLKRSYNEVDKLRKAKQMLEEQISQPFRDIIGSSNAMKEVYDLIDRVAKTDANVLILGENGTGKELVARAIHQKSLRHDSSFVAVDMGAITETLFESELFGHKKGSFTDAREDRPGRFELANDGTLFLDEIGNLSLNLQSKLLSALQSRRITRVGANTSVDVNIRLICATNMPVEQMVKDGRFRQDLLYRINTVEIRIPPLSERVDDIPMLVNHFLDYYSRKYRKDVLSITPEALTKLKKYAWPGNVRELQHSLERAVIMADSPTLQESDFLFNRKNDNTSTDSLNLDEVEKAAVVKALQLHNGNISKAADELGLTRASLYRRMEKYGV
ncbi:MAG: sigma-54-dependent Fis family transcriptional regulator [Cyclobacteriaceae bacterium]|nr:sigma-54-dependent Fis family transcriptional regulator [Cyclobacteriaceae bacterium]